MTTAACSMDFVSMLKHFFIESSNWQLHYAQMENMRERKKKQWKLHLSVLRCSVRAVPRSSTASNS